MSSDWPHFGFSLDLILGMPNVAILHVYQTEIFTSNKFSLYNIISKKRAELKY